MEVLAGVGGFLVLLLLVLVIFMAMRGQRRGPGRTVYVEDRQPVYVDRTVNRWYPRRHRGHWGHHHRHRHPYSMGGMFTLQPSKPASMGGMLTVQP
jgi:hypothetical protein